jgi:hypothetical protein
MRFNKTIGGLAITAVLIIAGGLRAQQPASQSAPVQQAPTVLTACTTANATAAVNSTATLTLTPPNGQYVYLCGLDITISFDATGGTASTNVSFTSTNLGGFAWKMSWVGTASTTITQPFPFNNGAIKSVSPGTAITIVSPAANLHGAYNINAYYYFAQ